MIDDPPRVAPPRLKKAAGYALLAMGIDPRKLRNARHARLFWSQAKTWRDMGGTVAGYQPMLGDYDDQAGATASDYFHQDLLVASFVHAADPVRHIDVGSRIDGFVAHLAVFRPVEVIDIRDLDPLWHPNISFTKADLMQGDGIGTAITDSLSCLHAIEHFGLGRYGDPIDPDGHKRGFANLWRMLAPGGRLYISFPIGPVTEVEFNAHRVFHPEDIFSWHAELSNSCLVRLDVVARGGALYQDVDPASSRARESICGIYTFQKPVSPPISDERTA